MKKINESTLASLVGRLREYMAEADPAPAAPAAAPAPGAPVANAPVDPAAGPANAKEQNFQTALKQIKDLYAKAQVPYPPTDKIVQQRFGLPDPLPATAAEWDGTMPKSTGSDFLTKNLFGRQASKDVAGAQKVNDLSNAGNAKADAATATDMAQLKTLVDKLKAMAAAPAAPATSDGKPANGMNEYEPGTAPAAAPAAAPAVPGVKAGGGVVDTRGGIGGVDEMEESTTYFLNKLRLIEADAAPAAAPAAVGEDKAAIIKQIQDIMARINGNNENPPADVAAALQDAQTAMDAANKAPAPAPAAPTGSAALDGTKPGADPATTIPGGPATAAGGPGKVSRDDMPFGKAFAAARAAGEKTFTWKGKPYTTDLAKPAAPKAPTAPTAPTAPAPAAPAPGSFGADVAKRKSMMAPYQKVSESITYSDDQSLARIIDLARR